VTLFIEILTKALSLLKVGMLDCMAMIVALPYQTALEGLRSWCLSPGFLKGVGPLEQEGSQKWSCELLVNEQSPAPSTHRASL
jgi:hypothetical protein